MKTRLKKSVYAVGVLALNWSAYSAALAQDAAGAAPVQQVAPQLDESAYARVLGALDCELAVVPAAMPTLEELGDLFE